MKSCLIVDDSSVVRKVARRILEDIDYIVDEAEDGQEAFDKCRQEMPDAILLDWQMPVMGGLEFLKLLRAYVGGSAPYIVFCVTENDIGQIVEMSHLRQRRLDHLRPERAEPPCGGVQSGADICGDLLRESLRGVCQPQCRGIKPIELCHPIEPHACRIGAR